MKTTTKIILLLGAWLLWLALAPAHAFYDPATQRWLNRDPMGESASTNLFVFVNNGPLEKQDAFGLQDVYVPPFQPPQDYVPPPSANYEPIRIDPYPRIEPTGPIFCQHPASSDAKKTQTGTSNTGNAPPANAVSECREGEKTPANPSKKVQKYCEGYGTITVQCRAWKECQVKGVRLNGSPVFGWVGKETCPCPRKKPATPQPER